MSRISSIRRLSGLGIFSLLVMLVLAACGDATNTAAPATTAATSTTAAAAATTAASVTTAAAATTAAGATTAAAGATTAAAGATTTAAGATAAASDTITPNTSLSGTVRLSTATSSPEEDAIVKQQLQNFAKAYPNVKVNHEIIASDYDTKIKTSIAGNNAPDVFYVDSLIAPDYINGKVLEPLNSYADKNKVSLSDFYPTLSKAFTGADNNVYGLPKDHNTLVMFYNKDMFQKAGITAVPTTTEELKAALTKLKGVLPADVAPLAADPDLARVLPWVYAFGGSMLSADNKASAVNSPGFKAGLDFYYGLRQAGLSKKSSELGADWAGDALIKEKAAVAFEGGWLIPPLNKTPTKDKVGIAPLPKATTQATLDFTVAYVMSSKSANKDAAFALLSFLTSTSQQRLLSDIGLALPSRQALTEGFVQKYPERKALVDSTNFAKPWQFGVGFGGFADKVNPELQSLFSGSKPQDQVIKNIDDLVKQTLSQ
jgi:multiple sugar transport system substrate-binding protein